MITAGDEDAKTDPQAIMDGFADALFGKLKVQAEADNKMLAEEAAKAPAPKQYGGNWNKPKGGGQGGGGKAVEADGSLVLTWGAFKGKSLSDVFEMTGDEAADFGYHSSGAQWVEWCANNDKNPFAADRAKAFLEQKRK